MRRCNTVTRHRKWEYPHTAIMGLDGARRAGWAKYYAEANYARELEAVNEAFREALVPELYALMHAVLWERAPVAFARAYRVQTLLDEYVRTHPQRAQT
jgi:hypothetical protein